MSSSKTPDNQIALYTTPDGRVNIEVLFDHENLWLTQKRMAELFECSTDNISLHIRNIYKEQELDEKATTGESSVVQTEGKRQVTRPVMLYSLEMIIAVGYRVNSEKGTLFRQWATTILHSYIQKGYALDSDRFKYGSKFSTRYFDELLEEIRDIRSSERLSYQKITDIYATLMLKVGSTLEYKKNAVEKLHTV
ncbi:MAG: virulence RhuM family protein [Treponema sp.]|nr:virulence RhuM family protein [Treponema sp.]